MRRLSSGSGVFSALAEEGADRGAALAIDAPGPASPSLELRPYRSLRRRADASLGRLALKSGDGADCSSASFPARTDSACSWSSRTLVRNDTLFFEGGSGGGGVLAAAAVEANGDGDESDARNDDLGVAALMGVGGAD